MCILWLSSSCLPAEFRSASRKYRKTWDLSIGAEAQSKLDMPGAPSNVQRVQV